MSVRHAPEHSAYTYGWFINQFVQARDQVDDWKKNINPSLLNSRPAPERWSAAECLDHLVEFGTTYLSTISGGLESASVGLSSDQTPFPPRFYWRWVIRFFEPPYKIKLKTIASFQPKGNALGSEAEVINSFNDLQSRYVEQLIYARQHKIDLSAVKVPHPVLSFLKMSISECLAVTEAHQRRHLWQARQTIQKLKNEW